MSTSLTIKFDICKDLVTMKNNVQIGFSDFEFLLVTQQLLRNHNECESRKLPLEKNLESHIRKCLSNVFAPKL